jgi:hypothetical protein
MKAEILSSSSLKMLCVELPLKSCVMMLHEVLVQLSLLPSQLRHDVACPLRQRDELFRVRMYVFLEPFLSFPIERSSASRLGIASVGRPG